MMLNERIIMDFINNIMQYHTFRGSRKHPERQEPLEYLCMGFPTDLLCVFAGVIPP